VSAKFEFIDAQKAQYAIVKMCEWLGVSTSGFYEWVCHERGGSVCRQSS
jgi:putative transposase